MENYVILEQIGEGSFGKVYKARRKNTGFIVAMKFITKHNKNPKDIKNLRQEIGILQKLNHEHIILMFDAFENDREFCVVTEYAQGELFNILEDDKKLSEATVQLVAKQLIKALYYLHSNRIIHRDMKPQNILIGPNGTLKLCDFGFARAMSSNTVVLTSIKGTPLYMSPELVREQPYDETSDLWSLGVILYELFVGQPPFYTNSIYSLINLIVKDPVKYPSDMKMSPNFKSFLQGLLQKNPAKRLTWPNLLYHPFIYDGPELVDGIEPKETKAAKEKREKETASLLTTQQKDLENSILNSGMGGPRVRLERLLLPDAGNMFGSTQVVSNLGGNCGPKDLPHVLNRIQVSERLDALADELLMEYVTTHPKTPTPLTREPVPASVNASAAVAIELNHKDSEDTESDYWENKAVQRNGHLGGSISAATGGGSVNSTPLRSTTAPSNSTRNTPIQSTHKSVSGRVPITAAVAEAKEVPRAHAVENTGHKSPSARQNEKRSDYQIENKTGSSSSPRSEAAASSQFSSPSKSRQHLDANNADAKITKTNHTHYHVNSGAVHGKSKETKLTGWEEKSKTNSPLVGNEPAEDTPALDTTQSSVGMLPEEEEPLEVSEMIEDQCDPPEHRLYMGSGHYTANAHVQSKSSYGNGDTDVSVVEEKLEYQAVHEDNHHHNGSKPNTSGSNKDAGFYFDGEGDVEVEEDMKSDYVSIQSQVPTEAAVAVTQSKALERKQVGDRVTSNQSQNAMSNPNPGQSFLSQHLKYWLDLESVVITQNQSNSEVESSSAIEDFDIALTFLTSDRFQLELQTIVDFDGSPETGGVTGYPEYEPAMDYDWVSLVYIAIRIMKYGLNACVLYTRHIYNTYLLNKTDQMPANCLVTCCKCFVLYNQLCSRVTYWSALSSNGINILSKHNIIDGDTSQRNTNPIQQSRPSTAGSSVVKFGSPSPRRKEPNPKSISTGLGEPKVGIGNQSICDVWVVVLTTISDLLSDILIINQASPQLPIYCDDLSGDTNESLSGGGIGMVDSTNIFKAVLDAVRMEQQAIAKYLHTSTASLAVIANSYSSLLLQSLQEYSTLVLLDAPARVGAASNASSIGITLTTLNQCVWKLVCPILEGNIGSVPGSVRSNSQSQHSIQSAQMSPGVPGLGLGFSGLNLSDRWSIVNMLIQILKYGVARIQEGQSMLYMSDGNDSVTVNTNLMASSSSQSSDMSKHSSHVNILVLFKQAFQTLNGLIHLSASSNEIHSMLIAQHIPTLLCDWIHVVQTDSGDKVFSTLSSCAMHSLSMLLYITTIYDKHPSSKCSLYSAYPASRGKTPLEHVLQRPPEGRAPPSNVVPASNTTDSITSYKEYTNNKIKTLVTVASYLFSNDALKARILMLLLKSMLCQCQVVGDTLRSTDGMDVLTEHQYEIP